jgi:hypothetical protein
MDVKSQQVEQIILTLTKEEAEKLRRACYFNLTIRDRVAATSGETQGVTMYEFLNDLGNALKARGIKRWGL